MTMNRRGFLGSIIALGAAPAIVRTDSLMRIVPRDLVVLAAPMNMDQVTREALRIAWKNRIFILGSASGLYEFGEVQLANSFTPTGAKIEMTQTIKFRRDIPYKRIGA